MLDLLAAGDAGAMSADGMGNMIAALAVVLSLFSFIYTSVLHRETRKREDLREKQVDERELRVEKSAAYLQLELASIDVFRYRAEHWPALHWAETGNNVHGALEGQLEEDADQFFYQCLNLFEVCSRFRAEGIIQPEIYGSWVAWFYEVLESRFFRRKWAQEYCDNYTDETRAIFDFGCANLDFATGADKDLRRQFYRGVGDIVDCDIIRNWKIDAGGSRLSQRRELARARGQ